MSATVLAAAGLAGPAAQPALAVGVCTGTAAVDLNPGVHVTQPRDIHVTQQGVEAGALVCTDPPLGALDAKTVDVYVTGTCVGTALDSDEESTIVVRFPGESSDSTIDISDFVLGGTSVSKLIGFEGTVRDGDPHEDEDARLEIVSAGSTDECLDPAGMTEFNGVATFEFI